MLTKADDYPIHQLPEPIATSGTDRNFHGLTGILDPAP